MDKYFRRIRRRRIAILTALVVLVAGFSIPNLSFVSKAAENAPIINDTDNGGSEEAKWTWTLSDTKGTLVLSGVTWDTPLELPCDTDIELTSGTTNRINSTMGINLNGHSLRIYGGGSLEINSSAQTGEAAGIYSSGAGKIQIDRGPKVTITSGTYGIKTSGELTIGQAETPAGDPAVVSISGATAGARLGDGLQLYNEKVTFSSNGTSTGTRGLITNGIIVSSGSLTVNGGESGVELTNPETNELRFVRGNVKVTGSLSAFSNASDTNFDLSDGVELTAGDSAEEATVKTFSGPVDDKYVNVHYHGSSLVYNGSDDAINVTCNVAGCKGAQLAIEVGDKEYDNQPVSPVLTGLESFNTFTGLTLSEANVKYYKVDTDGATTGGTLTSEIPKDVGFYYASITANSASAVMAFKIEQPAPILTTVTATAINYGQTLADSTVSGNAAINGVDIEGTWAFTNGTVAPTVADSDVTTYEVTFTPDDSNYPSATTDITLTVNKGTTTVTGVDPSTVPYTATYDVSGLFTISNTEVTASYSIETGSTGIGTISDIKTLNITSCGQFIIKCETTESANYAAGTNSATITISKTDISPTVTMAGFAFGATPTTPSVTGNTGNGEVTYTYWKNEICDEATTSADDAEGTNKVPRKPGTYWVQADIAATGVSNEGTCKTSFTISPGVITPECIWILENEFAYDGQPKSMELDMVRVGYYVLRENVDYEISGDMSKTEPGEYAITITGKNGFTGTCTIPWYILNTSDVVVEEPVIGPGAPKVVLDETNALSLLQKFLDVDEYALMATNTAQFSVKLTVAKIDDTISNASKALFEAAASDYVIGQYLDLTIKKSVNGGPETTVTETEEGARIVIELDDSLINTDETMERTYKVARNHGGTVRLLSTMFDPATKKLAFYSDQFSEYAIVYKDSLKSGSGSGTGTGATGDGGTQAGTGTD